MINESDITLAEDVNGVAIGTNRKGQSA